MRSSAATPLRVVVILVVVAAIVLFVGHHEATTRNIEDDALQSNAAGIVDKMKQRRETDFDTVDHLVERMARDQPEIDPVMARMSHLVLVPCHGIYRGADLGRFKEEAQWALEPHQLGHSLPWVIEQHIRNAIATTTKDPQAVLIFSGGQTRVDSYSRSEAQSYLDVAAVNAFDGIAALLNPSATVGADGNNAQNRGNKAAAEQQQLLRSGVDGHDAAAPIRRVFTEEFARDSYENLVFGIARFFEVTGHYPSRITVVGYAYKERRFTDLHRAAIRFPIGQFAYIGVDEPPSTDSQGQPRKPLSDAATQARVQQDLYMCGLGRGTRRKRNPNRRTVPYYASVPANLRALLLHCGPTLFTGALPWSGSVADGRSPT